MTIYGKLAAIQQELNAPKGQYNSFGKYNYRSCEDILEAVKPLLKKYEVTLILSDKVESYGDRVYVQATARLIDLQDGAEEISNTAYAREENEKKGMDASQVTGASSSYARKYALNGLFCIDDNKDSDKTNVEEDKGENKEEQKKKPTVPKGLQFDAGEVTPDQLEKIKKLVPNVQGMLAYLQIPNLELLGKEQAQAIIDNKA